MEMRSNSVDAQTYSEEISRILDLSLSNSSSGEDGNGRLIKRICQKSDDSFLDQMSNNLRPKLEIIRNSNQRKFDDFENSICSDLPKCQLCPLSRYCNQRIIELRHQVDIREPKYIDLFCGAGGLSLGFKQNGYILSLANDIEPSCIDTYRFNHPETPAKHIVLGDINDVISNIDRLKVFEDTDLVIGGPPCQGFSMANRQRLIDDPRNHLYKSFVDVVRITKPKFFVMENVKGMISVQNQVLEDFRSVGYDVSARVLNARFFGVPQNRQRLIFIGNRIGIASEEVFDKISTNFNNSNYLLKDALYGLRPLKANPQKNNTSSESKVSGSSIDLSTCNISNSYVELINHSENFSFVFNHKARFNNDRDIEIYSRLNQGDKSNDPKIADIMPYASRNHIFKDKYFKLEENKISKTITAHMKFDCNMYIHPTQARGLTPREAARIQSYPDSYFFRGSYTKTFMQIGNSVPPLMSYYIAKAIKDYLV